MALKFSKAQLVDLTILVLRWYLAYYMIDYGWSKLTGGQFGHRSAEVLNTPLKDVDSFNMAWHLFSISKTFNIVVGLIQIICAALIIYNRTVIIGTLLLLPVLGQIFLIDVAFTINTFGLALPLRLSGMIFAAFLVLIYYKERLVKSCNILIHSTTTKFRYKWWVFLCLPLLGLVTDFVFATILYPIRYFMEWLMGM